jgi:hypothetical protein
LAFSRWPDIPGARGWRLDFSMPAAARIEPRLRVAAALFQIEIERMSGG